MSRAPFWTVLGIEPVADRTAIRRAYAQQLKEIDPDADPQAFISLREALERATAWAEHKSRPKDAYVLDAAPHGVAFNPVHEKADGHAFSAAATSPPEPVHSCPWGKADGSAPDLPGRVDPAALDVIETLLFDQGDAAPDPDVLAAAVRRLLNDPAMKILDQADWVEHWLAEVVASSIPRSDAVVGSVAEHFGWDRDKGRWDQDVNIQYVVARHEGLSLLDRLANPKHDWHEAYLELTSTAPDLGRTAFLRKRAVKTLLEFVRARAPEAEGGFNPVRVDLWDEKIYSVAGWPGTQQESGSNWWWLWPAILGLLAIARCAGSQESRSNRTVPIPVEQRVPAHQPSDNYAPQPQPAQSPPPKFEAARTAPRKLDAREMERLNDLEEALRHEGARSGMSRTERDRWLQAIRAERARQGGR